QNLQSCCLAVV
ncbi:putative kinase, partial [Chlamydia psittaci 84-8471/1]